MHGLAASTKPLPHPLLSLPIPILLYTLFPEWLILLVLIPVSLLLTRLMITLGPKLGLIDVPDERRIHTKVTPRAGGVAVFVTFLIGLLLLKATGMPLSSHLNSAWLRHFLAAASLIFVIGLIDDRWGMSAWIKLGGQVVAAMILFCYDPGGIGRFMGFEIPWVLDLAIHVAWTVALINAFNLIDGMDGLCAGLGVISMSIMATLAIAQGHAYDAIFIGLMIVALLGFLRYNFHPARIFLGDSGSMLIGFFIASVGANTVGKNAVVAGILLPLLVGGVPLLDVALAIWRRGARRLAASKPGEKAVKIFAPDADHLHHRIIGWGFTQRQAAFLIYSFAIGISIITLLPILGGSNMIALSAMGLVVIALVGLRYIAPVEFLASGHGLRALIRRPKSSRLTAIAYFVYDLAALSVAATLSWWLVCHTMRQPMTWTNFAAHLLVFDACAILALRFSHAYSRRWSRASLHDFAECLIWMACGVGVSFALLALTQADFSFRDALFHLAAGALGFGLVFAPRSIGFFLQESVIDTMHRKRRLKTKRSAHTTLIYGAGDLGELFICHLRLSPPDIWKNEHFIGFIDDSEALAGRRLRGFPIHGSLAQLPDIIQKTGANGILVTSSILSDERHAELLRLADELKLNLRVWNPGLQPVSLHEVPLKPDPSEQPARQTREAPSSDLDSSPA